MDKLDQYRQIIQDILLKRSHIKLAHGDVETQVVFDKERDHYQIVHVGWDQGQFIYGCAIHIDIKNNKIWLQWNSTEDDLAAELVEAGVPKEDIVLGLQAPEFRQFTDYAVG